MKIMTIQCSFEPPYLAEHTLPTMGISQLSELKLFLSLLLFVKYQRRRKKKTLNILRFFLFLVLFQFRFVNKYRRYIRSCVTSCFWYLLRRVHSKFRTGEVNRDSGKKGSRAEEGRVGG